MVNSRRLLS
jgi:pimeloyl-ACP methyl ester carboxylesterase